MQIKTKKEIRGGICKPMLGASTIHTSKPVRLENELTKLKQEQSIKHHLLPAISKGDDTICFSAPPHYSILFYCLYHPHLWRTLSDHMFLYRTRKPSPSFCYPFFLKVEKHEARRTAFWSREMEQYVFEGCLWLCLSLLLSYSGVRTVSQSACCVHMESSVMWPFL